MSFAPVEEVAMADRTAGSRGNPLSWLAVGLISVAAVSTGLSMITTTMWLFVLAVALGLCGCVAAWRGRIMQSVEEERAGDAVRQAPARSPLEDPAVLDRISRERTQRQIKQAR
ncbi:MAG: hypothetical protein QOI42_1222 [Frankiaceae bacterium]|jgi:hypothetical protein|nr:hypothetical protein [Frankiaceae bacterium]